MPSFKREADALLNRLLDLKENILDYDLRVGFLADLSQRSERLLADMEGRPDDDPHKAIATMMRTASFGTREDEFTTPKLDALRGALVLLGASTIGYSDIQRCRSAMLWAGLLGYGYSGGKRATVDGKY